MERHHQEEGKKNLAAPIPFTTKTWGKTEVVEEVEKEDDKEEEEEPEEYKARREVEIKWLQRGPGATQQGVVMQEVLNISLVVFLVGSVARKSRLFNI